MQHLGAGRPFAKQAHRRDLHGIDGASAAEAHERVGIEPARLRNQRIDGARRHVLDRAGEHSAYAFTTGAPYGIEQFGASQGRAGDDQGAGGTAALELGTKGGDAACAEYNALKPGEAENAGGRIQCTRSMPADESASE